MMIKVGSEYLEFDGDIDVDRQANLFEDISKVNGDFSYSFELPNTKGNREKLGIVTINSGPQFNEKVNCILYTDQGEDIYYGYLRIEQVTDIISCSFFGGNNDWFVLTNRNLREFNYVKIEKNFNFDNLINSHAETKGVVWPLVDRGTLNTRSVNTMVDNDWQPFVYVKDVINSILSEVGIKLKGDILLDPLYNSMITSNNGLSGVQDKIDTVSVYASKTSNQTINSTSFTDVSFQDSSTAPYFEGSDNNWTSPEYIVTKDLISVDVEVNLDMEIISGALVQPVIRIDVDGTSVSTTNLNVTGTTTFNKVVTIKNLYSGSVIKVRAKLQSALNSVRIKTGSTIKITPTKLRRVYPAQLLPNQIANEYISSIFARLNCFVTYNSKSQTIHTKFLDNIVRTTPIDISQNIESIEYDYSTLIDDYGRRSLLTYADYEESDEYNSLNAVPYGAGAININNDFISDEETILELDEVASYQVDVPWLGFKLPLLNFNEYQVESDKSFLSVDDDGGYARFEVASFSGLSVGDLVRISDSSADDYLGLVFRITDLVVDTLVNYVETELQYVSNATGTLEVVTVEDVVNENQVTLLYAPSLTFSDFTETSNIIWYRANGENSLTEIALGYFWLPQVRKPINSIGRALYFDTVNFPEAYQKGILESYFKSAEAILNNPVIANAVAYLPIKLFRDIDFLRPVRIETDKFVGNFLVNRIQGYKGSEFPCELELIKIS